MTRPRCACGYLAASHGGLRWHWEQMLCQYGGPPARITTEDLGIDTASFEPSFSVRYVDVDLWRFDFGSTTFGDFDDLDMAIDELAVQIKKVAQPLLAATKLQREALPKVPMVRFYIFPAKRHMTWEDGGSDG